MRTAGCAEPVAPRWAVRGAAGRTSLFGPASMRLVSEVLGVLQQGELQAADLYFTPLLKDSATDTRVDLEVHSTRDRALRCVHLKSLYHSCSSALISSSSTPSTQKNRTSAASSFSSSPCRRHRLFH
eukprot:scaffold6208_cov64-Phaeocystis_antarctica.AAC.2